MSQRDSRHERKHGDSYETPEWVTLALVPHLPDFINPGESWADRELTFGAGQTARAGGSWIVWEPWRGLQGGTSVGPWDSFVAHQQRRTTLGSLCADCSSPRVPLSEAPAWSASLLTFR
jgi:hypothetical protein